MSVEPVSRDARRAAAKKAGRGSNVPYLVGVLVILAAIAVVIWMGPAAPPPLNLAATVSDIAAFDTFEAVGAMGWVGVLAPGEEGTPKTLDDMCKKLEERFQPGTGQTITLLNWEGVGVRTCGDDRPKN